MEGENVLITFVVAEACEHRRVLGERVHADAGSLGFRQRVQEVIGQVRSVAGAAAVAAQKHLAVSLPAVAQVLREANHG